MMANTQKLARALALLACLGLAPSARGEPEPPPERAGEDLPVRKDDTVSASVPAQLVARLALLEQGRRQKRAQALSDPTAWAAGRAERAAQHRQEIAQVWGNLASTIDGQAKLRMHAERMSRFNRILDLAERGSDKALVARVRADIARELIRHAKSMQASSSAVGGK
ncbi:MAG TPA: hypothetical protein VGJ91_12905 [Polyangiaceae bacterium]